MLDEKYLHELLHERTLLDRSQTGHSLRLLEDEIEAVRSGNKHEDKYSKNGFQEEVIEISEKIFLPIKEFPRFNFVGKLLGPKGSTLKGIQSSTNTKILILGQGSTRDVQKEEELLAGGEAEHDHFRDPLHLLIKTRAPKSEAHGNIAASLAALTRCMGPEDQSLSISSPDREPERGSAIPEQPLLRYGIPPPGAIIIGQPFTDSTDARTSTSPLQSKYKPTKYESKRYSEDKYTRPTRDSFQYSGQYSDYPVKRQREETFDQYAETDPYPSSAY